MLCFDRLTIDYSRACGFLCRSHVVHLFNFPMVADACGWLCCSTRHGQQSIDARVAEMANIEPALVTFAGRPKHRSEDASFSHHDSVAWLKSQDYFEKATVPCDGTEHVALPANAWRCYLVTQAIDAGDWSELVNRCLSLLLIYGYSGTYSGAV